MPQRKPRNTDAYCTKEEALEGLREIMRLVEGRPKGELIKVDVELRFWAPERIEIDMGDGSAVAIGSVSEVAQKAKHKRSRAEE